MHDKHLNPPIGPYLSVVIELSLKILSSMAVKNLKTFLKVFFEH